MVGDAPNFVIQNVVGVYLLSILEQRRPYGRCKATSGRTFSLLDPTRLRRASMGLLEDLSEQSYEETRLRFLVMSSDFFSKATRVLPGYPAMKGREETTWSCGCLR